MWYNPNGEGYYHYSLRFMLLDIVVNDNYDWIENISLVGGSGRSPIEKTVDITVAKKFKKRGMSWYKSGANPLLRLKLLKLNGQWDTYWQRGRREFVRYAA